MFDALSRWLPAGPARMVHVGLWSFFAGTGALLCAILAEFLVLPGAPAELAQRYPGLPTWFVPESPAGYTAAVLMVCWGVWALGAGLQHAQQRGR